MQERRDPEYYEQFVVKEYKYWTLFVNQYQTYLGKAVVWLRREGDMQRLSSLNAEEREELFENILPEYEAALEKIFKPYRATLRLANLRARHLSTKNGVLTTYRLPAKTFP
jgi:diadenosine tetraphosphate (Ap4A) HIT family hydrolase